MKEKNGKKHFEFIDFARVFLKAGNGGNGCLSFRREKYIPYGGPDGGNGGRGGNIYIKASSDVNTLFHIARNPHIKAENGKNGKGKNLSGKSGRNICIYVPCGTVVKESERVVCDLKNDGDEYLAAQGGRGGRGNTAFKTPKNTAPRMSEKGEPGEEKTLNLELSLLADVGLVGFPNAGKSTLLSRISQAHPRIADYPFTTLNPNLGTVFHKRKNFVIADIPGLIEGASRGKGLGDIFLRHIMRTKLLLHLIDPLGFGKTTAEESVEIINKELEEFHPLLPKREKFLIVNKSDLPNAKKIYLKIKKKYPKKPLFLISAATGEGIAKLLDKIIEALPKLKPGNIYPAASPRQDTVNVKKGYEIVRAGPGRFAAKGKELEKLLSMTNFSQGQSLERFQKILKHIGIDKELKKQGIRKGEIVVIGNMEFEWLPDKFPEP